jgi:hypothetical protein
MLMVLAMGVRVAYPQDSAPPGTAIASYLHLATLFDLVKV